jgi:hypothetical protein
MPALRPAQITELQCVFATFLLCNIIADLVLFGNTIVRDTIMRDTVMRDTVMQNMVTWLAG